MYYWYMIKQFFTKKVEVTVVVEKQVVTTLHADQFKKLEASLPNTMVTSTDDVVTAAHKLGVQHALNALRRGFTS